jgi:hypothetical protein
VNVLFDRLPTRRSQKATRWEVLNIELAVPTPLRWSQVSITFSCVDQWTGFSDPGRFSLVLKPVVAGSRLNKVLIDGGSGLNVLFTKTLKKMKLDITHMLTKSTSPFYGIVPGNAAIPLGSVVLLVTFGETKENYRTEYIKFKVVVGVLDRQTYQGGTRDSRLCGEDHDRETENSKVCARRTQDLYRFGLPRWRTLHPVWGIKYGALRLVLVEIRCPARYPALLYIVQRAGS